MKWPLPQEINEAVQTPAVSFADADLRGGEVVVGASGLPLPRSGNFADVYQVRGAGGRDWAVKCFTRPVVGLDQRYEAVAAALSALGLPFTVGFTFLTEGLRVAGRWYPVVKMEWIEGHQLQQFARQNLSKPAALDALVGMWAKLSRRLRDAGIAHGDLQHGNVLLVAGSRPGSLGLKLIDYDGMFVPALANRPSGEVGHPSFQHPQRADQRAYSPDLDRFPHLVVATALKALAAMGQGLWDRYDNGDNLLFTEADLRNPAGSPLLRELWQSGHPEVRALAGRLAAACRRPIPQTPWLDQVAPDGVVKPLSPQEEKEAVAALGLAPPVTVPARPTQPVFDDPEPQPSEARRGSGLVPLVLAGLALAVVGGAAAGVYLLAFANPTEVTQTPPDNPEPPPNPEPPAPKPEEPPKTPGPKGTNPKPPSPAPPTPAPKAEFHRPESIPTLRPEQVTAGLHPLAWSLAADQTIRHARFSLDGRHVLTARGNRSEVAAVDSRTGGPVSAFTGHTGPAFGVAPLADGKAISQQADRAEAVVWDQATGQPVRTVKSIAVTWAERGAPVFEATADGRYLAVGHRAEAGEVAVADTATGAELFRVRNAGGVFLFTPDGSKLLVAEDTGRIQEYALPKGDLAFDRNVGGIGTGRVVGVSAAADLMAWAGRRAGTEQDGEYLVRLQTGEVAATLPREFAPYLAVAVSPDGQTVAALSEGAVTLLDVKTGARLAGFPLPERETRPGVVEFSPDGGRLVARVSGRGRLLGAALPPAVLARAVAPVPAVPKRVPVPDDAAAAKSEADLREVYKAEFARRTAADRKALAEKLLDLAKKTPDDPAARYVMLRTARDLAVEAADPHLMAKAADELGALYELDGAEVKAAGLEKILPPLTQQAALRAVVDVAQIGIELAIEQDSYDAAVRFAVVVAQATRKGLLGPIDEVDARLAQVRRMRDGFVAVKKALDVLKETPDDPAANLAVGRHRCFAQGRWADGVKLLAKGSNPQLKLAAELEQAPAPDGAALAKVGDAWWDYAQTADPADKRAAETRARSWYARAVVDLTGIPLARAQARLELTVDRVVYRPGLVVESQRGPVFEGKRGRIDAVIDFDAREVERQGGTGGPLQLHWSGAIVPEKPGRYRLIITLKRTSDAAKVTVNRLPVLDTTSAKAAKGRRFEAAVTLTDRPNSILVDYRGVNQPGNGVKLSWVPPGLDAEEEVIPAAFLFHDKKLEAGMK